MFRLVGKEAKFCASFSNKLHICFLEYDKELQKYETFRNRRFLKNTLYFLTFLRPTDALLHERENKLLRFWKFWFNLPSMKEHIERESPELETFVRSVNENAVDRYWPRRIHLSHRHRVIREETQLQA